jgi:hypothetical protein
LLLPTLPLMLSPLPAATARSSTDGASAASTPV